MKRLSLAVLALAAGASAQEPAACPPGYILKPMESFERPTLSRGGGRATAKSEPRFECVWAGEEEAESGGATSEGTFLEEVRDQAFAFSEGLPNFLCDQETVRFESKARPPRWKRKDRLSAEVLFIDDKESYRELKKNGKKLKNQHLAALGGTWSFGEVASLMLNVLHPASEAEFEFVQAEELRGIQTRLYDFTVERENSQWRLEHKGEVIFPAYKGSLWVDPETLRVLRVEVEAVNIPNTFMQEAAQTSADYGAVEIAGEEYLLITDAEFLACRRYSQYCARNTLTFRNYRMFSSESTIMQTDSTVTFEGAAPESGKKP